MQLWQFKAKHWSDSTKVISILLSDCGLQFSRLPMHLFVSSFHGVIGVFTVFPTGLSIQQVSLAKLFLCLLSHSASCRLSQPIISVFNIDAHRFNPTNNLDDTIFFSVGRVHKLVIGWKRSTPTYFNFPRSPDGIPFSQGVLMMSLRETKPVGILTGNDLCM